MDENASMENSKMKKVFQGQSSREIGDRISNLPDNIIHYILSLLPTKYAVGTSVLSNRWKCLWTGIHNLDFCEQLSYSKSRARNNLLKRKQIFIDFVDRVLPLLDVSNIIKFSLKCREFDAAHIIRWITTAKKCNVEELLLTISLNCRYVFPLCLFTSESLKVLEIGSERFSKTETVVSISIPSSFCFATLKVLRLQYITISFDRSLQKVSLSFPTMEEFIIKGCTWLGIKNIDISAPKLQMLTIDDGWTSRSFRDCEIKVSAESLMSLHFRSRLCYKYSLHDLSSLVDAFIHLTCYNGTVKRLGPLLRGIFHLKNLHLAVASIRTLSHPNVSAHMRSLSFLTHLSVLMYGYGIGSTGASGRQFVDLLCNMPNIESIYFPHEVSVTKADGLGVNGIMLALSVAVDYVGVAQKFKYIMDESDSSENSIVKKTFEGQSSSEIGDRISNLPENILHYILSFLPTKYAVGTSVLSSRWKYLWTGIHNLDFCEQLSYSSSFARKNILRRKLIFIDFVDRVLPLLDVSNILKFRLSCMEFDISYVNKWISTAIRCNVNELILSINLDRPYVFPFCRFNFESLKVLKLGTDWASQTKMYVSVNIPDSTCFPNLRVLHLIFIPVSSEQSTQDVYLTFPILEECLLEGCTWLGIKNVHISAPKLQKLKIKDWWNVGLRDCKVKIYAESLVSLELESCLSYEYFLCNLSSLANAFLHLSCSNETVPNLGSLLSGIHNVKDLQLAGKSIPILSHPDLSAHMRSLSRLTCLRVKLRASGIDAPSGRQLIDFLCNMPNIESMFFPNGIKQVAFKGHGRLMGTTPRSFLSHLKLVHIKYFTWKNNEMWFVRFLMKSARVMDKLTIKVTTCPHFLGKYNMGRSAPEELQLLARDSNCAFEFI
ncbi:hypothetical protein IFM89_031060 [Coptis chinensis]|uniref:F-box domain-containing protein n=1 Tax=Coptis chinensis TaxID=261450 RepID=A0A835LGA8_9MAGN|nr:hypothetical protein IFM89_031060 [Coptis chinensis]